MPRWLDLLDADVERRRLDLLALGAVIATAHHSPDKLEALLEPATDPADDLNRTYRYWEDPEGAAAPE